MSWLDAFYPGNIKDIPLPPGPPKPGEAGYDDYQRLQVRLPLALTSLAPGALAQVMPVGRDDQGNLEPTVPGVVSSIYGGVGSTVPWLINKGAEQLGYQTNLPAAPGAEEMQRQYADTSRLAKELIPTDKLAENETEQRLHDYAFSAGGMYVPGMTAMLSKLPSIVSGPAKVVVPTAEHFMTNAPISAVASGVTSAYEKDHPDVQTIPGLGDALSPAAPTGATPPTPTTAPPVPTDVGTQPPTSIGDALDKIISGQAAPQPAPTFSQLGESPGTVGGWLAAAGGILLAGMAGKRMLGIGQEMSATARAARLADPAYAQKAADFQAAQIAAQGSQVSGPQFGKTVEAPIPQGNAVHTAAVAAETNVLDHTAQLQDLIKMTAQTPQAGERLAKEYGILMNDAAQQPKMRAFLNTGVDYATKLFMPAPKRLFDDIGRLSDTGQKTLNDMLHAQDEMNNRAYMQTQGTQPARFKFSDQSDQDLARIIVNAQRDPLIANLADRYGTITRRIVDVGEAQGFYTPGEAQYLRTTHPNYVPTVGADGNIMNVLEARNYAAGGGAKQVTSSAWESLSQYLEKMQHQIEVNTMRSKILDHIETFQANNPQAAKIVERVRPGASSPTQGVNTAASTPGTERTITVRRPTGVDYYKINNHDVYDMLTNANANKMKTMFDAATITRRTVSAGTTGALALLRGRMFPLVNAARTAFQLPINREAGRVGGLLDYGMQKATGGRLGYRGIDPTNLPGAAYSAARTGFDDTMLKLSNLFDKTNTGVATQTVKSIVTPQVMDSISAALKKYYLGTTTYQKAAEGVGGSSVPYRLRLPAYVGGEGQRIRSMSSQLSPRLFLSGGKLGTIKPGYIRLQDAVDQIFTKMSDASHDYYYRLNNFANTGDAATRAYETRAITGDPGIHGGGSAVAQVRGYVPYANVSAQGLARRGQALKDTPVGTSAAWAGSVGSLALLSIYTAMQHPETLNYLQNMISTQGREGNAYIFNGPDPSLATMFSMSQEDRLPYAPMLDIISKAINLAAAPHDPEVHDSILGFLKDWFSEHIENSTVRSTQHALADALNIADVPPAVNAISGPVTGKTVRLDLDRILDDYQHGGISFDTFAQPAGTDHPLPNQAPGDTALDAADGKKWSLLFSNLFGIAGAALDAPLQFNKYYNQTGDWHEALGQVGRDWLQDAMDNNPMLNHVLWENPIRASVRPPIVEAVSKQLDMMKPTAGNKSAERYEGTTGGPRPLEVPDQGGGEGKVPTDPTMRNMFFATAAEYNFIQSHVMPDIMALKKQMATVADHVGSIEEKRQFHNEGARVIADKYGYIQSRIEDLNAGLSKMVGKHVDVAHINWKQGPDQFNE
jgi:hypothetical protein